MMDNYMNPNTRPAIWYPLSMKTFLHRKKISATASSSSARRRRRRMPAMHSDILLRTIAWPQDRTGKQCTRQCCFVLCCVLDEPLREQRGSCPHAMGSPQLGHACAPHQGLRKGTRQRTTEKRHIAPAQLGQFDTESEVAFSGYGNAAVVNRGTHPRSFSARTSFVWFTEPCALTKVHGKHPCIGIQESSFSAPVLYPIHGASRVLVQRHSPHPVKRALPRSRSRSWKASLFERFFGRKRSSRQTWPHLIKEQAPTGTVPASGASFAQNGADTTVIPRARARHSRHEPTRVASPTPSSRDITDVDRSNAETCIAIRHVHKVFPDSHAPGGQFYALCDILLDIEDGSLVALVGPSGSGKSTLLRCIAGLENPTSGRIFLHGRDTEEMSVQERRIGFVFQHYALWKHMTVWKNIAFGLEIRKTPRSEIERRVLELLKLMGLEGLGDRYPHQLSGGQRQRVALARALAPEPRVLLLDEPFGALDTRVRRSLRAWLRRLHDEVGTTTIFVTHDQQEALEIASSVVVMNKGQIEQVGTPLEIYEHPASPFVMSFMGDVSVVSRDALPAEQANGRTFTNATRARSVETSKKDSIWSDPERPPTIPRESETTTNVRKSDNAAQYLMLRPHDVHLHRSPDSTTAPARVVDVFFLGWSVRVDVELQDGQILQSIMLTTRYKELGDLYPGDLVHVKFFGERSFEVDEAEYNI